MADSKEDSRFLPFTIYRSYNSQMAIPTLGREGGVVSKRRASSIHPSSTSQSKKKRRDENTRHGRHYALGPQRQPFSLWKP